MNNFSADRSRGSDLCVLLRPMKEGTAVIDRRYRRRYDGCVPRPILAGPRVCFLIGGRLGVGIDAAAFAAGAHPDLVKFLGALPGVGIFTRDHDDVAAICRGHAFAIARQAPGKKRFRAHVMVHEHAPVTGLGVVGQGAVQEIAVEEDDAASFDFDGNGVVVAVGKLIGDSGTIEAAVLFVSLLLAGR